MKKFEEGAFYKATPNTKVWRGIEIIVRFRENEFCLVGWEKEWDKKVKEAFYKMEQEPMFGVYINDRKGFLEAWNMGEYESTGSIVFKENELEIKNLKKDEKDTKKRRCRSEKDIHTKRVRSQGQYDFR